MTTERLSAEQMEQVLGESAALLLHAPGNLRSRALKQLAADLASAKAELDNAKQYMAMAASGVEATIRERDEANDKLRAVRALVDAQAEDEGLWFAATTAPEAYLQQQLRALHAVIEGKDPALALREALGMGSEEKS